MLRPLATAALFSLTTAAPAARAQTHHVAPPEKVTRAIAVYEWTGDLAKPTASRLVPVSLFINGHMEDAGLYLARPVPFALQPGDLYSIELAGEEKGTFDLEHARDFTTGRLLADQEPMSAWYGFGRFSPLAPPKPPPVLHASAHPPVIVSSSDSGRPTLTNKSDTKSGAASQPDTPPAKTPSADDPDRPTLGRHNGTSDTSTDTTPQTSTTDSKPSAADTDPERPTLRKRSPENTGKKSPPTAGVTGPDRSLNDDPDRPTIRHGKTPAQEEAAELKGTPADLHQVAAVSDAARREPHLFTREWDSPTERANVLTRLQALARTDATAYLSQNRLIAGVLPPVPSTAPAAAPAATTTPAPDSSAPTLRRTPNGVSTSTKPTPPAMTASQPSGTSRPHTRTATHPATRSSKSAKSAKPAQSPAAPLLLTAEQLTGYTLTYGGLPTFVYTAEVPVTTGGPVYVTVVAQRLPSGELQTSLHSITDATHLDRTPWMRPVDAVDPDASHRASLLFELRAQTTRQFALYRLVSAQAEQQFVSDPIAK